MPNSNLDPPTLSEVIRRLDELRADVREMGGRFVSVEVYLIDKQVHDKEAKELAEKVAVMAKESDAREQRAQDQAAKNRLFWIGIIAGPFISMCLAFVISGGLRP